MVLLCVSVNWSFAQDYTQTQNRIKSIYIYNFIKDIQWPSLLEHEEVTICLFSKSDFFTELEKLAATKKINNKKLTLKLISSISNCETCDLIFIEDPSSALKRDETCGSLIITSGFYEKSISNIVLMFLDNKLQFSINQPLCDKFSIRISTHLAGLANQKIIQR